MSTTDPTPYTPTDEDMEDRYVRHSLALMDFPRGDRDEWEQKLRIEFRRGLARVRAEAVAPVLALHQPRVEQVIIGDCAAEECEHEDECPTVPYTVCAECYRVAEESDPYFGERGLSSVAHPCPTVRAASIEQETQP